MQQQALEYHDTRPYPHSPACALQGDLESRLAAVPEAVAADTAASSPSSSRKPLRHWVFYDEPRHGHVERACCGVWTRAAQIATARAETTCADCLAVLRETDAWEI
jgi:hypothetical protein